MAQPWEEIASRGGRLARVALWTLLIVTLGFSTGCMRPWLLGGNDAPGPLENPLFIPAMDREFLWNQTVDSVDDYFRIEREERVRLIAGVLTEGRIDTFPLTGSTVLEPWRTDSTPGYEKWHATFQSIRRRATVRVIPAEGGYLLDVVVQKELEDLDRPENATAGGATLRYDGSLVRQEGAPGRHSITLGWIPIGRDVTLEQRLLSDIRGRLEVAHPLHHLPPAPAEEVDSPSDVESLPAVEPRPLGAPPASREERLDLSPPENLPLEALPGPITPPGALERLPPE
jgi:hypothetical protein